MPGERPAQPRAFARGIPLPVDLAEHLLLRPPLTVGVGEESQQVALRHGNWGRLGGRRVELSILNLRRPPNQVRNRLHPLAQEHHLLGVAVGGEVLEAAPVLVKALHGGGPHPFVIGLGQVGQDAEHASGAVILQGRHRRDGRLAGRVTGGADQWLEKRQRWDTSPDGGTTQRNLSSIGGLHPRIP